MSQGQPWLLVRTDTGEELTLPARGTLVLGSDPERANLLVTAAGVDASHGAVGRLKDGGWAIQDLGAAGGTRLNGKIIRKARLQPGDRLVVGTVTLVVRDPSAPVQEPEPDVSRGPSHEASRRPSSKPAEDGRPLPRIGGFRLERRLGRGGMGDVYLAIQESLDRPVALKVLSPRLAADADFVARFQREARAAAALQHPNVVVVYDVGEDSGLHYLAMEFVSGGTLEERVAQHGPIPWRLALGVLADAARGLEYAEEQGIVHRDVKPANLMLDGSGTAKLADLGLATGLEAEGEKQQDRVYGTPHFISPEQVRGEPVDARSDLYSLGATAYRLLSGRTPFQGDSQREILRAHLFDEPEPIDEVPTAISDLVLRLLAKDPADRPRSASELLRLLQAQLTAEGSVVENVKRRSSLVWALPLLLVVLGAVAAWFLLGPGAGHDSALEVAGGNGPAGNGAPSAGQVDEGDASFLAPEDDAALVEGTERVERELRILELEGQIELRDLPASLTAEERIAALEDLAERYAGTSVAMRAEEEIDRTRRDKQQAATLDRQRAARSSDTRRTLSSLAGWPPPEGELPHPARSLSALAPPAADAGGSPTPEESRVRRELIAEIATASLAPLSARLERSDELTRTGDFTEAEALLSGLAPRLDLPELSLEERTNDVAALFRMSDTVALRLASLDDERARFEREQERADRERLERALGVETSFLDELLAWDQPSLKSRFEGLADGMATEEARTQAQALEHALSQARAAIDVLVATFEAGEWRRRSIADPRARRAQARDVIAVRPDGLVLEGSAGNDLVTWEEAGFTAAFFEQLFSARLDRDYTAEENARIVVLLRLAAATEAARRLGAAFGETVPDHGPSETSLTSPFAVATAWRERHGVDPEALRDEALAARSLERVRESIESGRWSEAEIRLEELLAEHAATLLVLVASDGSGEAQDGSGSGALEPSGSGERSASAPHSPTPEGG